MMHKSKNTNLAKSSENAPERSLASRNPWDWFEDMDRWFNDLRDEFSRKFWGPISPYRAVGGLAARQPLVDLADNGREYVLTAELPGVNKEDLDLRVTPDGIEFAAETRRDKEENEKDYYYRERSYESFRRALSFPEEVLAEQADAKLKDGVLEVRVPKKEPSPRHEPVKVRVG